MNTASLHSDANAEAAATDGPDAWTRDRATVQAREDLKITVAVLVCYLIDAALLAALVWAGIGAWTTPLSFVAVGLLVSSVSVVHHLRNRQARLDTPGLVLWQVSAALLLSVAVAWMDPQMLLPMLLTQGVMLSTGAIRLQPRQVLLLCLATAGATTAVLAIGTAPLLPHLIAPTQQALIGLWLLWTLAKGASTNLTGMAMRLELDASHRRLAEALARVQELAERDELTGLYNRRRVLEVLAQERTRCLRGGPGFSVAMLDIDHFKRINDGFGHPVGDVVLRDVAAVMRQVLRNHDVVGRFGGEEFLLVLPGATDLDAARQAAERVRRSIEQHDWQQVASDLRVTASMGLAVSRPGEPAETLLDRSDRGLYRAKREGRNRVASTADD